MEKLYCNICEKYTEHNENICSVCQAVYDPEKKRYVICGASDHPEVMEAKKKFLEVNPGAIIISEESAFENRTGIPVLSDREPYFIKNPYLDTIQNMEDIKYSHLSKKEKEVKIEPIRSTVKILRNDLCPCGSGLKYKHCCLKK